MSRDSLLSILIIQHTTTFSGISSWGDKHCAVFRTVNFLILDTACFCCLPGRILPDILLLFQMPLFSTFPVNDVIHTVSAVVFLADIVPARFHPGLSHAYQQLWSASFRMFYNNRFLYPYCSRMNIWWSRTYRRQDARSLAAALRNPGCGRTGWRSLPHYHLKRNSSG